MSARSSVGMELLCSIVRYEMQRRASSWYGPRIACVGQKRGLGLATGRPLFVLDLDPERDTVTVGEAAELERGRLVATSVNFIACAPPSSPLRVAAKIRHSHEPAPATVTATGAETAEVVFDAPQRAVTPGQSVVFYDGDVVVGGGVIARTPLR